MKKLMYLVWKPSDKTLELFRSLLLTQTSKQLTAIGIHRLRMTFVDSDVNAAHKQRLISAQLAGPPGVPDAVISFWLNHPSEHSSVETILKQYCNILCGYQVSESEPLINTTHPTTSGQRTIGMNQVVFLRKPERITREQWLEFWLKQHTPIAIATQSTFGYRQNIVTQALTDNALPVDAIVEENFPPEAMTSTHAFYNAVGNDALMRKNQSEMFSSVQRFIDLDKLDCLPMSEYNF